MKPIVTPRQMAELDRLAIEQLAVPGLVLMENAGRGLAEIAMSMLTSSTNQLVHIYCGSGNNGGDGYVIARHLLARGYEVELFLLGEREKIKGDSLANLIILEKMDQTVHLLHTRPESLSQPGLIVDALLGTGASVPVQGLYADVISYINEQHVPILAVDLPTGINGETGAVPGPAVLATVTATMAMLKSGLLLAPAREQAGDIRVVDLGLRLPQEAITLWLLESGDIGERLPVRPRDAYKNQVGTVAVLAGSVGFCGAATLTAMACLRSGAGLCYLAIPSSLNEIMATKLTEVVLWPVPDRKSGFLTAEGADDLAAKIAGQNACAIGPGLGQAEPTAQLLFRLLEKLTLPIVLDADGLNICSGNTQAIKDYGGEMVLTPHPGELARLMHTTPGKIAADRVAMAKQTAQELNKVVVLKGSPTLIADPKGLVFFNPTGNAGMATAGSGDVLTGIIAAMLGQGLTALDAALVSVYLHGLAGDLAKLQYGESSMIAGDILLQLGNAFIKVKND